MYTIILFYKYVTISDPEKLKSEQKMLCESLGLKGRMIIAKEGINATLEGEKNAIASYMQELTKQKEFVDIHFKKSTGDGNAFPKLSIKVRPEIVSGHLGSLDINPQEVTGKYITAEKLHEWITSKEKEFYIVDMRNDYEQAVGYFEGFIASGMKHFKDLPDVLPKIAHLKDKTIVTVCTGGVRCEKASGYLLANGFTDVYQLDGGIVSYMERYPNEDFLGKLYVFDSRMTMGFYTDDPNHEIVGTCVVCTKPCERFTNCSDDDCHRQLLACQTCEAQKGRSFLCPQGCKIKTRTTKIK
jgi:UPF0176 protein